MGGKYPQSLSNSLTCILFKSMINHCIHNTSKTILSKYSSLSILLRTFRDMVFIVSITVGFLFLILRL